MIGAPTRDPKQGDRRQKALSAAVAARMRSMGGGMSRFAKTGFGRGARTGVGTRPMAPGGGRPSGVLNFLSAKDPGGFGPGGVNYFGVNPGLGSLPEPAVGPPASLPGDGPPVGGPPFGPPAVDPSVVIPGAEQPISTGVDPNPRGDVTNVGVYTPKLIPLGGGVWFDPDTGALHGAGLGAGPLTDPSEPSYADYQRAGSR